jgi:hypothetical protein
LHDAVKASARAGGVVLFLGVAMPRPIAFIAGLVAGGTGYLFVFDSLWRRAEAAAAGLREVQRAIPGSTLIPYPVRPDPWTNIEESLARARLGPVVVAAKGLVSEVRSRLA